MPDRKAGGSGPGPLSGITVLVTRAAHQAEAIRRPLVERGAGVILSPAIRFEDPPDWSPVDRAFGDPGAWDWLILTSVNGVEAVSRRLERIGTSWSDLRGLRVAAIGPATEAALSRRGLAVQVLPEKYRAEGILEALSPAQVRGKRILLARAETAREILPEELRQMGAEVEVVAVYRTVASPPSREARDALLSGRGRNLVITFTSASTVEHFLAPLDEEERRGAGESTLASIGPITSEALSRHGLIASLEPTAYTIPALIEAIEAHFRPATTSS